MDSYESFLDVFGNAVERNIMVATLVYLKIDGVIVSKENLINTFFEVLDNFSTDNKVSILRLFPLLGETLKADAEDSAEDQSYLGVKNVTKESLDHLRALNQKYLNKFKYPFVSCARTNTFDNVLKEIPERYNKSYEEGVTIGMEEVKKICKIRILDLFEKEKHKIQLL